MHLFQFAFFTTGTLYGLFVERIILIYFLTIIAIYVLIGKMLPRAKQLSIRKKIMLSTWTPPSQGIIYASHSIRMDKVIELIDSLPTTNRPTLTHFVIKAIGQILHNCPQLNGKLVFGKLIQFNTSDVSCVVNIDEGKDLAIVLVQDVHQKSVQEIAQFIKNKAHDIKQNKGDKDHKTRMASIKYVPPFIVPLLMAVSKFIFFFLGLSIKAFSVKENQFGAAVLTSICMIGFQNATAPLIGMVGCSFCVTLNAVRDRFVIYNGKVQIGKVANVNFALDHRYIDVKKCQQLLPSFLDVFEYPENYLRSK